MRSIALLTLLGACSDTTFFTKDDAGEESYALADEGADGVEPEGDSSDTADTEVCDDALPDTQTFYLSADDSNSTAGAAITRGRIVDGDTNLYTALRPYEFLNYYSFDYAPAETGAVRVVAQARPSTEDEDSVELLIAVVAPALDPEDRAAANFTFSVDASGSMTGPGINGARAVMRAVAGSLMAGDIVSIVAWDNTQHVALASRAVDGPDDSALLDAITDLTTGGSTDLSAGLLKAYELAKDNYASDRLNRVILISDGGVNTGETDEEIIGGSAEDAENEGIYMMGVGVGEPRSFDDAPMDKITDIGKGAYLFIDSSDEATAQFSGASFVRNTQIAAYDVRLELDLPASYVVQRFEGEQISTNADEVRPQHLAPNDVMLYNITLHDCDPDSHDGSEPFAMRATWSDLSADHTESISPTLAEMMDGENLELTKARAILDYVDALVEKRDATDTAEATAAIDAALGSVDEANTALGGDDDLTEIHNLLTTLRSGY